MSKTCGDTARFNRLRKQKIARRQAIWDGILRTPPKIEPGDRAHPTLLPDVTAVPALVWSDSELASVAAS